MNFPQVVTKFSKKISELLNFDFDILLFIIFCCLCFSELFWFYLSTIESINVFVLIIIVIISNLLPEAQIRLYLKLTLQLPAKATLI